jgi:hypothetical protein
MPIVRTGIDSRMRSNPRCDDRRHLWMAVRFTGMGKTPESKRNKGYRPAGEDSPFTAGGNADAPGVIPGTAMRSASRPLQVRSNCRRACPWQRQRSQSARTRRNEGCLFPSGDRPPHRNGTTVWRIWLVRSCGKDSPTEGFPRINVASNTINSASTEANGPPRPHGETAPCSRRPLAGPLPYPPLPQTVETHSDVDDKDACRGRRDHIANCFSVSRPYQSPPNRRHKYRQENEICLDRQGLGDDLFMGNADPYSKSNLDGRAQVLPDPQKMALGLLNIDFADAGVPAVEDMKKDDFAFKGPS